MGRSVGVDLSQLESITERLLHSVGIHGLEPALTFVALLVAAGFAGDWIGGLISKAVRRRRHTHA